MAEPQEVRKDWNAPVIVAASGPSLTKDVAWACRTARWFGPYRIVAVSDAYRLLPLADILYSCDSFWWDKHDGVKEFKGEKWSSQGDDKSHNDDKRDCADKHGLRLVRGRAGAGFSTDQSYINYGSNSGFQAVNLALLKGATKIVLVGFDMRVVNNKTHFFGSHPPGLRDNTQFQGFIKAFEQTKPTVPIINATPGSALKCFPMMELSEALKYENDSGGGDRPLTYPVYGGDCPA